MDFLKIGLAAGAIAVGIASYYWGPFRGKADNPVEQASEKIILQNTGFDVDLTPNN